MSHWLVRLLVAAMLLLSCALARGQSALELVPGQARYDLAPQVRYFHDTSGTATLEEIRHRLPRFQPLPADGPAFGFQTGAFWFHAVIVNRNPDEPRWLLVQQYPLSDRLDVYQRLPDGTLKHYEGGDHLPFVQRSVLHRQPNFWLDLPLDAPVELLVRVQSESSMQVPLALYTPTAFTEQSRDAQFGIGLYYGILLALFIYNLVLWLALRDANYFWYLFHITAFGLVLFTLNGLGFEYLWPNSSWLADKAVPLSICLSQIGMQQFSRHFLDLKQRWRLGDRISLGFIVFFVLLGIASTQLTYHIATPLAAAAVFLSIAWIAVISGVVVRQGYRPAQLFLLAWSLFLLGTCVFVMLAFGLLPKNFFTEYGVQIGSALEMLLLSVALGYRYAALRNENERIVRNAKHQLEQDVQQRTSELRSALEQLESTHKRLSESSRRDGLTGLYNRVWFREAFDSLLVFARESKQPLALMMIDLDHFKRINDTHGHLAGDACLRWAAERLHEALHSHDALLARYGGEEFIVVLPLNLTHASAVAEELRQHLRAAPCVFEGMPIALSASIGVYGVDIGANDSIEAALQVADQALYAAKAQGRDCVRAL